MERHHGKISGTRLPLSVIRRSALSEGKLSPCSWTWEGVFHGVSSTLVYVSICEVFTSTAYLCLLWA